MRYSNGNTLPLTQLPFGMCPFCPQTDGGGGNWFFSPDSRSLEGIRLTHQPSPWIGEYGTLIITPMENTNQDCTQYWSGFKPEETVLAPHYMKLKFLRSGITAEVTPSMRGGFLRFTQSDGGEFFIAVRGLGGECFFKTDSDKKLLTGYVTNHSDEISVDFKMYFVFSLENANVIYEETVGGETSICLKISGNAKT